MRREIYVTLVNHTLGKVAFIRCIVGAKDAGEIFTDRHQMVVIAEVWIELFRRRIGWDCRESDRCPLRTIDSRFKSGDPSLARTGADQALIKQADLTRVVYCKRRIKRIIYRPQIARPCNT